MCEKETGAAFEKTRTKKMEPNVLKKTTIVDEKENDDNNCLLFFFFIT
jgi:hypothetical protein